MNNRFNYHPYLGSNYLRRDNKNRCMNCGRKLGSVRPDLNGVHPVWIVPNLGKAFLIGYCHVACPKDKDIDLRGVST